MKIKGKTILITGGGLRIGRAIALDLAKRGAFLILHYHRSKQAMTALKQEIEALGAEVVAIPADFSSSKSTAMIKRFTAQVFNKVPHVDVLINNASNFYPTPFGKIKEKDWDAFMNVNLKTPFFLSQEVGNRMIKRRRGKIINIVDWTVNHPHPDYLPYVISKAGLQTATVGLAKALAPNIHVNSIAPGPILPSRGMNTKRKKDITNRTLLKKFGDPKDIVSAVRYLIEDGDYITGVMLPVDGGSSAAK